MNMLLVWLVGVLVTCAHPAVPRRISPPQRAPNIRDYIMINRQLYYYVQHRQNVKQPPNIVQKSSFMLETLDAMQSLMTGGSHYNRTYFTKLRRCMDTMGPQLARSQDAAWKGILTYWNNNGSLADPWGGTNLVYMEKNSSRTMQDNMIIYEPCNYASNVAFYHVVTEFCDRVSYGDPFSIPKKYVKALGKAFSQVAMGSSFMHGSHTNLGAQQDTRAMNVMAYVIHQASILPLRSNSPILRDLSLRRRPYTSLELADEFEKMFIAMPVETWYNRTAHLSPPDYNLSLSGIVATLFSVGLSKATVDNILPSVMDLFGINRDIKTFILQRYLPTLRRSLRHVELGYIEGTVYLGNVINLVMKFFYVFLWQEDVMTDSLIFQNSFVNEMGSYFLPTFNNNARMLTNFNYINNHFQSADNIYPGDNWCQSTIPHAKWHLQSAVGGLDLVYIADEVHRILAKNS